MNSKRVLKFYFNAEKLNAELDNFIMHSACGSGSVCGNGELIADKILHIIDEKRRLAALWRHIDGVICSFDPSETLILNGYARLRHGISKLGDGEKRAVRRAVIKFSRRTRFIDSRFSEELKLINVYYCIM